MLLARSILIAFFVALVLVVTANVVRVRRAIGTWPITVFRYPSAAEITRLAGVWLYTPAVIACTFLADLLPFRPIATLMHPTFQLAGAVLLAVALTVLVVAFGTLGTMWRIGIDPSASGPLVTHGIYSLVRHPIYGGVLVIFIGVFLAYPSPMTGAGIALCVAGTTSHVVREERFLVQHFGDEYRRYCERTGRLFPRIFGLGRH